MSMTENEVKKYIEELREKARLFGKSGYATAGMEKAFHKSADTIENLLNELEQYRAIGTVKEFKALKEKSVAKKVIKGLDVESRIVYYRCPNCDAIVGSDLTKLHSNNCPYCGQSLKEY